VLWISGFWRLGVTKTDGHFCVGISKKAAWAAAIAETAQTAQDFQSHQHSFSS
jgi:hypothetical protein